MNYYVTMLNKTTYMVLLVKLMLFISEFLLVKVQIKPIEKVASSNHSCDS